MSEIKKIFTTIAQITTGFSFIGVIGYFNSRLNIPASTNQGNRVIEYVNNIEKDG